MPVPPEYQHIEAYHFVHLDNFESLVQHGLLSCNEQARRGIKHRSVAISGIQSRRATMNVPINPGGVVHDYVPFYFCRRSPMLLSVLNAKNVDQQLLIYLCLPITVLDEGASIFTDSSANRNEPPKFFQDSLQLAELNWREINSLKWKSESESLRHQKMAELLIHTQVEFSRIQRIVVWNESIAKIVRDILDKSNTPHPIIDFDTKHYFTRYPSAPNESLVTGPIFAERRYREAVGKILAGINQQPFAKYPRLSNLREALRLDLTALPETAELIGLETNNPMHPEDLGTHTRKVAETLRALPEWNVLEPTDQMLTEIAAFFHDMGKGPKSRWVKNGGKYIGDRDHPLQALPMLERILVEDIAEIRPRSVRVICKLVAYHDLFGDILGKNRDAEQLSRIIDDERELNMLIALAKADVLAVHGEWWDEELAISLREQVRGKIGTELPF